MIVEMLTTKTLPLPPTGSVSYTKGAQVNVSDELAHEWLAEDPPAALDPNPPAPMTEPVAPEPIADEPTPAAHEGTT